MIDTIEECQEAVDELYGSANTVSALTSGVYPRGCFRVESGKLGVSYHHVVGTYGTGTTNVEAKPNCKKPEPPAANGGGGTS